MRLALALALLLPALTAAARPPKPPIAAAAQGPVKKLRAQAKARAQKISKESAIPGPTERLTMAPAPAPTPDELSNLNYFHMIATDEQLRDAPASPRPRAKTAGASLKTPELAPQRP